MVSLGKTISNVRLICKILRSLPERFRIRVTTIEESKDLEEMKIQELVGSLQIYELSLPSVKKVKTIAFKASKKKVKVSFEDDLRMKKKRWHCWPKFLEDWWWTINSKRNSPKDWKGPSESLNLRKLRRKIQEVPDVLNAQALGIYGLIVEISSREKGRHIMRLSVMSLKKNNLLIKTNF
jgi:hypothetical protein